MRLARASRSLTFAATTSAPLGATPGRDRGVAPAQAGAAGADGYPLGAGPRPVARLSRVVWAAGGGPGGSDGPDTAAVHDPDPVRVRFGQLCPGRERPSTTSPFTSRTRRAIRSMSSSRGPSIWSSATPIASLVIEGILWSGRGRQHARSASGGRCLAAPRDCWPGCCCVSPSASGATARWPTRTWRSPARRRPWRSWRTRSWPGAAGSIVLFGLVWAHFGRGALGRGGVLRAAVVMGAVARRLAATPGVRWPGRGGRGRLGCPDGPAQRRLGRLSPGPGGVPAGLVAAIGVRGRRFRLGRRHAGDLQPQLPHQLSAPDARHRAAAGAVSAWPTIRTGPAGR